jgi:glutamine synthetase
MSCCENTCNCGCGCDCGCDKRVDEYFGVNVFNLSVMREKLPKDVFKAVKATKEMGKPLTKDVANVVANAMKDWAVERGATHYTHWFQPMTGITAEKHDSFISPAADGKIILEFSGKELIKGEPDASSFPSGGLRATFEARGYTTWDPTSDAFVREGTLYIPTAFSSYTGEVLDKKTPLLRSMEAVNVEALRILKLFGNTKATRVQTTVGPEQEYFLIDKKYYDQRLDLILTGRTLFGAKPPKGQELEDHYFGSIKDRVANYMSDLDSELWKLGILAKTKHNEVAPAQHELAPIFSTTNVAADHNQLTMDIMRKVALKHGLVCLLHEKPFAGVNGSGKHNNWSISSNDGQNLLDPGKTPLENLQFLTFLVAIIKAVDEYAPLLRLSAASAGNDHRLGANEAPPAVISIFVGEELQSVLDAIKNGTPVDALNTKYELGVDALPSFAKDTTDRNRTSPFAFTGNKFEFRMLGSNDSISCTNIILNTIMAKSLREYADKLEKATDFTSALKELLAKDIKAHERVIYNGDGYAEDWVQRATTERGLPNLVSTVDAVPRYTDEKYVSMFEEFKIYTKIEVESRTEILLENYSKVINIEALTALDIAKKQLLPAAIKFTADVANAIIAKAGAGLPTATEAKLAEKLSNATTSLDSAIDSLDVKVLGAKDVEGTEEIAKYYRNIVFPAMQELRSYADELETLVSEDVWPLPTYSKLLFNV